MKEALCFVLTGGGTGGHIIPGLAVARELRARGHTVRFIGTERGLESKLVPAQDFPIDWIEIGGLNRVGWCQTLITLLELPWSIWQASRVLDRAQPVALFSTGGYVAGPVILAALWKRIPVVVLEPNAMPGFTHRKIARFVARALLGFEATARWFPPGRAEVTGLPVRDEFFALPPKPCGPVLTVLITGGSQGSRTLNRAVKESCLLWQKGSVRLLHQAGRAGFDELASKLRTLDFPGEIVPFFDDMPRAFAQADLVVSRAGMGTVSELAAAGKPSILVPLPMASDQHQLRNAEAMVEAGAARLVLDAELTGARLVEEVTRMAAEPGLLKRMGAAAKAFSKPGAARRAAEVLESLIQPVDRRW